MVGTFGGALEARQIAASEGNLVAEATGEVELEGKVLVIKRIHVRLRLRAPGAQREAAERVAAVYRTLLPMAPRREKYSDPPSSAPVLPRR